MAKREKRKRKIVGQIAVDVDQTLDDEQMKSKAGAVLFMGVGSADVSTDGKKVGEIGVEMGCGVTFSIEGDNRQWHLSAADLWGGFYDLYQKKLKKMKPKKPRKKKK